MEVRGGERAGELYTKVVQLHYLNQHILRVAASARQPQVDIVLREHLRACVYACMRECVHA